jgi:alkylation response protein AidB-like acyl-CoA dehydrogenase
MGLSRAVVSDPMAWVPAFEAVAALAAQGAQALDECGGPQLAEVEALAEAGLLSLPFSPALGGVGLARGEAAARMLPVAFRILGRASLPLGRLHLLAIRHGPHTHARA